MARRPLERERIYLDGGRRTTQLIRNSLGGNPWISVHGTRHEASSNHCRRRSLGLLVMEQRGTNVAEAQRQGQEIKGSCSLLQRLVASRFPSLCCDGEPSAQATHVLQMWFTFAVICFKG